MNHKQQIDFSPDGNGDGIEDAQTNFELQFPLNELKVAKLFANVPS